MLVMMSGSVTVETLPVNVSTRQVLEEQYENATQRLGKERTPRADTASLEHSPSGCVCRARVNVVVVVAEVTNGKTDTVGVELQEAMRL
jgi:hypothetical protein